MARPQCDIPLVFIHSIVSYVIQINSFTLYMECVPMEFFDAFIHIMTPTISSREYMDAL
jgi:hypothetical protein